MAAEEKFVLLSFLLSKKNLILSKLNEEQLALPSLQSSRSLCTNGIIPLCQFQFTRMPFSLDVHLISLTWKDFFPHLSSLKMRRLMNNSTKAAEVNDLLLCAHSGGFFSFPTRVSAMSMPQTENKRRQSFTVESPSRANKVWPQLVSLEVLTASV